MVSPAGRLASRAAAEKGGGLKWLLGGLVVVLAVALAVTTTLLLKDDGGNKSQTTVESSSLPTDIASANDTGPVSIVTVEPTCSAFNAINNMIADVQAKGWASDRKALGPPAQWTPDQRTHMKETTDAMRRAADQVVPLAKQTPHRVIRELYEQLIAYWRAYADSVPAYDPPTDDHLADVTVNASTALIGVCNSITYGAAPLVTGLEPVPAPTSVRAPGDPSDPQKFITAPDATCKDWMSRQDKYAADSAAWAAIPSSKPSSQWTPDEAAINQAVFPIMTAYADANEKAGRASGNPTFEDFAVTSAIYLRAIVAVGMNYTAPDGWLATTSLRLAGFISTACRAAGA